MAKKLCDAAVAIITNMYLAMGSVTVMRSM